MTIGKDYRNAILAIIAIVVIVGFVVFISNRGSQTDKSIQITGHATSGIFTLCDECFAEKCTEKCRRGVPQPEDYYNRCSPEDIVCRENALDEYNQAMQPWSERIPKCEDKCKRKECCAVCGTCEKECEANTNKPCKTCTFGKWDNKPKQQLTKECKAPQGKQAYCNTCDEFPGSPLLLNQRKPVASITHTYTDGDITCYSDSLTCYEESLDFLEEEGFNTPEINAVKSDAIRRIAERGSQISDDVKNRRIGPDYAGGVAGVGLRIGSSSRLTVGFNSEGQPAASLEIWRRTGQR